MKVLHTDEFKYFFTAKDRRLVKSNMRGKSYIVLARAMGFTYKTLWSKLNSIDGSYFDHIEIECLQKLLNIEFIREN